MVDWSSVLRLLQFLLHERKEENEFFVICNRFYFSFFPSFFCLCFLHCLLFVVVDDVVAFAVSHVGPAMCSSPFAGVRSLLPPPSCFVVEFRSFRFSTDRVEVAVTLFHDAS